MRILNEDNIIGGYVHLTQLPRADQALETLKKVASLVKPIMRKHGWRISQLAEFYPAEANLLGTNRLPHIQVRLRSAYDVSSFLPYENVVDTMVHEITHCRFGPHDEKFWNLYNSLQDELTTLRLRGYTGEGFLGKGQALGTKPRGWNNVERTRLARAAEERRKKQNGERGRVLHSGGFGPLRWTVEEVSAPQSTKIKKTRPEGQGRTVSQPPQHSTTHVNTELSPYATAQQLAAFAALQRKRAQEEESRRKRSKAQGKERAQDPPPDSTPGNQGCPGMRTATPSEVDRETALMNGFTTVAEMEDANEKAIMQAAMELLEEAEYEENMLDLTTEENAIVQAGPSNSSSRLVRQSPSSIPSSVSNTLSRSPDPSRTSTTPPSAAYSNNWSCPTCTYLNPQSHLQCLCGTIRPDLDGAGSVPTRQIGHDDGNRRGQVQRTQSVPLVKEKVWMCHRCSNVVSHEWWSCTRCGCVKLES